MDKYLFIHNMNYFDLLPEEITDYIYELAHKSQMKEVLDTHMFIVNNFTGSWEKRYSNKIIVVSRVTTPPRKGIWKQVYPKYVIWQHNMEERNLNFYITLLTFAYNQKKKDILFYAFTEGIKLYKSWTKKKMIDTLDDRGRLIEVIDKCINN
mgnify:CR=1 FL=1|tara:strand:- start:482 stop:937 length:456 start_codon:yes stop_codon:yes gene_type:complete